MTFQTLKHRLKVIFLSKKLSYQMQPYFLFLTTSARNDNEKVNNINLIALKLYLFKEYKTSTLKIDPIKIRRVKTTCFH